MEANILLNQNKYELKYIKIQPGKLISEVLKPGFTQTENGKYPWSKKRTYKVDARWESKAYWDGIPVSTVEASNKFKVFEGKLYERPFLEIIFDNQTIVERFDDEQQLNDRLVYLKDNVFFQPAVKLIKFNTEGFEYQSNTYFM